MEVKQITTYISRNHQKFLFGVEDSMLRDLIKKNYNASEDSIKESIRIFREWFEKQYHLPRNIHIDDGYIMRCLSNQKFSMEGVKRKIDNLLTAMTQLPEFYADRDPDSPKCLKALDQIHVALVPKLTKDSHRVIIFRMNPACEEDDFNLSDFYTILTMLGDMRMEMDVSEGDIYIMDMSTFKLAHAKRIVPTYVRKFMFVTENCYAARIRQFHIVNTPAFAEILISLLKTSYKKLSSKMYAHSNVESLQNHLSKEVIPRDFNGEFPLTIAELSANLLKTMRSPEWKEWFSNSKVLKTDESKRQMTSNLIDNMGIHGTFRKLDID